MREVHEGIISMKHFMETGRGSCTLEELAPGSLNARIKAEQCSSTNPRLQEANAGRLDPVRSGPVQSSGTNFKEFKKGTRWTRRRDVDGCP